MEAVIYMVIVQYFRWNDRLIDNTSGISAIYCKMANIRGGFNFAMFAVDDFSAKLNHRDHFTTLMSLVICCYMYVVIL